MTDISDAARIARAERAEKELEFVQPIFAIIHQDYLARMAAIAAEQPWETAKISKLATAARVVQEVEAQFKIIIADGKAAEEDVKRARAIEKIHPERRRILGI